MREKKGIVGKLVIHSLIILLIALVSALFYGVAVYYSDPDEIKGENSLRYLSEELKESVRLGDVPSDGKWLQLSYGEYQGRSSDTIDIGGVSCEVHTLNYSLSEGRRAEALTASDPAYMEVLATQEWMPQYITGMNIGTLPAVYYKAEGQGLIAAEKDGIIYMIRLIGEDEEGQTLYMLGAGAFAE